MGLISRKLYRFLFVFNLLYIIQCITTFSSIITICVFVTVFDAVSSNIDEIVWINPSANGFVLEEFNMHCKGWLTYSGWTSRTLLWFFYLKWPDFPTQIPDCDSHSPALLDMFLLMLVFVLQWLYLQWEILIMLLL